MRVNITSYFPHALISFLFAFYLLYNGLVQEELFLDSDTGWHIAAGELIRIAGKLPAQDPWSFTAGNTPWMNISWLFDMGLSWLYRATGLTGLAITFVTAAALLVAWVSWLCLKAGAGVVTTLTLVMLYGFFLPDGMLVRPQFVTYAMVLAYYTLLRHYAHRRLRLFLLPLLMMIWINCHGGFLAGYTIIAAFMIEAGFQRRHSDLAWFSVILGLCVLASLTGPYGVQIYHASERSLSSALEPALLEWQALPVMKNPLFAAYVFVYLAGVGFRGRRMPMSDRLLGMFWLLMALSSKRHLFVFIFLMLPSLARALTPLTASHPWLRAIVNRGVYYDRDMRTMIGRSIGMVFLIGACIIFYSPSLRDHFKGREFQFNANAYPAAEVAWLEKNRPHARLFNDYLYGGYTIFMTRGRLKVAVDGRADTAYPKAFLENYLKYHRYEQDGWYRIIESSKPDALLLTPGTEQAKAIAGMAQWKLGMKGPTALVFVRARP